MQVVIINIMNQFGYLGIMLLIAIENIFPPIPSEVILTFGGFMTQRPDSQITILGVVIAATIGSMIGAIVLYYIGKLLNKEKLKKIVSGKVGKVFRLKRDDIEKADKWFEKKGSKTVFFCRFIPIVRSLISIPAGMNEMPFSKFLLYTFSGSVIWNIVLIVLGSILGKEWEKVASIFNAFSDFTLVALIILFIVGVSLFYFKRKKKKDK